MHTNSNSLYKITVAEEKRSDDEDENIRIAKLLRKFNRNGMFSEIVTI